MFMILLLEDVRAKKKKIKDRRIFMINFKEDENLNNNKEIK